VSKHRRSKLVCHVKKRRGKGAVAAVKRGHRSPPHVAIESCLRCLNVWVVQYCCRRKVEGKTRNQNKAPQNEVMRNAHKQPQKKKKKAEKG